MNFADAFLKDEIYKHTFTNKKDLISPSDKRRVELFIETYRSNETLFSKQLKLVDDHVQNSNLTPKLKNKSGKIKDYKNVSDDELKKYGYTMFNIANEYKDNDSKKMNSRYYKTLTKNGYNALIDDNNKGIYNQSNNPLIVLDAKKNLKRTSSEVLTTERQAEAEKELRKYLQKKTGSDRISV